MFDSYYFQKWQSQSETQIAYRILNDLYNAIKYANHKSHIWHGSGNKHENRWRRLGFDPQDPKSWEKLLPILQEAYENSQRHYTGAGSGGSIVHYFYYYAEELSAEIRVVITELETGIWVLSDASVQ